MKNSKLKQVGNFEKLVSFANAQGTVYNPGKAAIKVAALQTLLTQAQVAIQAADVSRSAYEASVNARQELVKAIPKLARRIHSVLKANGAPADVLEDVAIIKRRFTSRAKTEPVTAPVTSDGSENGTPQPRKRSYLDLESMIGNFSRLVIRGTSEPLYVTNEADLKATALTATVTALRDRNKTSVTAYRTWRDAEQNVNRMLFDPSGIFGHATAAKAYIESLYGFGSLKHKQVTVLNFKKQ
jgi:hypothetical protein